jgi:hypothetical protein
MDPGNFGKSGFYYRFSRAHRRSTIDKIAFLGKDFEKNKSEIESILKKAKDRFLNKWDKRLDTYYEILRELSVQAIREGWTELFSFLDNLYTEDNGDDYDPDNQIYRSEVITAALNLVVSSEKLDKNVCHLVGIVLCCYMSDDNEVCLLEKIFKACIHEKDDPVAAAFFLCCIYQSYMATTFDGFFKREAGGQPEWKKIHHILEKHRDSDDYQIWIDDLIKSFPKIKEFFPFKVDKKTIIDVNGKAK